MQKKENFALGISIASLLVTIVGVLYGDNLVGRLTDRVDSLDLKLGRFTDQPSNAPVTEIAPPNSQLDQELRIHNLKLADSPRQAIQIERWLSESNSGYPALLARLRLVIGKKRFRGNTPSLATINRENLRLHGRQTSQPFETPDEIDTEKLRKAAFLAWFEKNSSSSLKTFASILE